VFTYVYVYVYIGHVHIGEKYGAEEEKLKKEKDIKDRIKRQEKAGIHIIRESWTQLLTLLLPTVRGILIDMVTSGVMREVGLCAFISIHKSIYLHIYTYLHLNFCV
jgi:hypothetical protein